MGDAVRGLSEVGVESELGLCGRKRECRGFAVLSPGARASRLLRAQRPIAESHLGPHAKRITRSRPAPPVLRCLLPDQPNLRLADLYC